MEAAKQAMGAGPDGDDGAEVFRSQSSLTGFTG